MTPTRLSESTLPGFLEYCRSHEKDHDESFLGEEELNRFSPDENITWLLMDEGEITGAFSVILKRHNRVRIFHTADGTLESYRMLHEAMIDTLEKESGQKQYSLFITEEHNAGTIGIFKEIGLKTDRYIYVMERERGSVPPAGLPGTLTLTPVQLPEEAALWAGIRNEGMKEVPGFLYYGAEFFSSMNLEEGFLGDCTLILRQGDEGIGIIKAEKDVQESESFGFIGPIAVLPAYRGRGYGRACLRTVLSLIENKYGWKSSLCVNADNEDALKLYLQEGFHKTESVVAMDFKGH